MQAWYLVYTKPQGERTALANLARQGFDAYLPLMRNRRRRGGRHVSRIEPMFPRYLFIHLSDVTDDWGPIRSTIGVASMVSFANRAARVPDGLITALRAREGDDGVQVLVARELQPGDRVRIEEGVFQGYEGIFQAKTGKSRVLLLLEIAGKSARMQICEDHVQPV
jgi:transcriptional antiterminator RfaH